MKKYLLLQLFVWFITVAHSQRITYRKDIAPLIAGNCVVCHHKGGPAPFPLTSYEDVAEKAGFISYITAHRIMPPWKANPQYHHFANERLLSDEEIGLFKTWYETGSRKGFSCRSKEFRNQSGVLERKADLELKMPEPVKIEGNNKNVYYCYKIPFELEKDTFGRLFEFLPGNLEVLHHASFQIISVSEDARIFDAPFQTAYDWEGFADELGIYKKLNMVGNDGRIPEIVYSNSWLPGSTPQIYPQEFGFRLPERGVILFNFIHYQPSPIDQSDLSGMNIYFSGKRPERIMDEILFKPNFKGTEGIVPKDSVKTIRFLKGISRDISIFTVIPHMHRLGKYFKAFALSPDGDTIPIVEIKSWDFNWQEYYRFEKPLVLKAGSAVIAEAIFDNTSGNAQNPFTPPRDIYFNDVMSDEVEMMHLIFLYANYKKGDEDIDLTY